MTNEQKYTTSQERVSAFRAWRKKNCGDLELGCRGCEIRRRCDGNDVKFAYWLTLPCEDEKPEPCPFCGGECVCANEWNGMFRVVCHGKAGGCWYSSSIYDTGEAAIAAHNRVCRAVERHKASKEA